MTDKFERLKELKQMLQDGLIDDQEYSQLKSEILAGNNQDLSNQDQNQQQEENNPNQTHCPNCGSSSINSKDDYKKTEQERSVNWGRAVAGWALFGVVGGAVGAVTGDKKYNSTIQSSNTYCYCLNCGTTWDPQTIFKLKETIKNLTGFEPNLAKENHRQYVNEFIHFINPLYDKIRKLEFGRVVELNIKKTAQEEQEEHRYNVVVVFSFFFIIIIFGLLIELFNIAVGVFGSILLCIFIASIYDKYEGSKFYKRRQQAIARQREEDKKEAENLKKQIPEKALEFHNQNLHLTE